MMLMTGFLSLKQPQKSLSRTRSPRTVGGKLHGIRGTLLREISVAMFPATDNAEYEGRYEHLG